MYTGIMNDSSSFDDNNIIDYLGEMVEIERDKETISSMFNEVSVGIEECLYFEDLLRIKTNDKYAIKAINTSLESAFIRNRIPRSISLESEEKKRNFILRIYDWIMEKLKTIKEWFMGLFSKYKEKVSNRKYENFVKSIDPVFFDYKGEANPDPKIKAILDKDLSSSLFLNTNQEIETNTEHIIFICSDPSSSTDAYYSEKLMELEENIYNILDLNFYTGEKKIKEFINNMDTILKDINRIDNQSPFIVNGNTIHKCIHPAKNPIFIKHDFKDLESLKVSILTPTITNLSESYPSIKKYIDEEAIRTKINSELLIGLGKAKSIIPKLHELAISSIPETTKLINELEEQVTNKINKIKKYSKEKAEKWEYSLSEEADKLITNTINVLINIIRGIFIQNMNYVNCAQALLFNLVSVK